MSGLELQQTLSQLQLRIADHLHHRSWRSLLAVQAMKWGACGFIGKPFRDQVLLDAVAQAVRKSQAQASEGRRRDEARQMLEGLSPREREGALLARPAQQAGCTGIDISEKNGAPFSPACDGQGWHKKRCRTRAPDARDRPLRPRLKGAAVIAPPSPARAAAQRCGLAARGFRPSSAAPAGRCAPTRRRPCPPNRAAGIGRVGEAQVVNVDPCGELLLLRLLLFTDEVGAGAELAVTVAVLDHHGITPGDTSTVHLRLPPGVFEPYRLASADPCRGASAVLMMTVLRMDVTQAGRDAVEFCSGDF